jgi:TonB family protein
MNLHAVGLLPGDNLVAGLPAFLGPYRVVSNPIRGVFVAKLLLSLQQCFRICLERQDNRLQLAFAISVLCHVAPILLTISLPLAPSSGGQSARTSQALYAVLAASPTSSEDFASGSAGADAISGDVAPQMVTADESRPVVVPAAKPDQRSGSETTVSELVKPIDPRLASQPAVPGYLSGAGLDQQPRVLNDITVEYPHAAGDLGGKVVLRILVSETGRVDNLFVVSADPSGWFEEEALKAFSRAEFVPGKILGLPVKSQFFVEVKFAPTTRDNVSAKSY